MGTDPVTDVGTYAGRFVGSVATFWLCFMDEEGEPKKGKRMN